LSKRGGEKRRDKDCEREGEIEEDMERVKRKGGEKKRREERGEK
jgi:hypothetical protein